VIKNLKKRKNCCCRGKMMVLSLLKAPINRIVTGSEFEKLSVITPIQALPCSLSSFPTFLPPLEIIH